MELTAAQARVVGSLVEKQLTTPQQYPLTANALLLACNQSSNRDPVVDYTEDVVAAALDDLRQLHLVRFVLPSHGRSVVRYRHVLDEVLGFDQLELAVVAVLVLRGPQTVGELRIRTERMAEFESLSDVERTLVRLAEREEPVVERIPRRPGQKEDRWCQLFTADGAADQAPADHHDAAGAGDRGGVPAPGDVLAAVSAEVASLSAEVAALRAEVADLRSSLGG